MTLELRMQKGSSQSTSTHLQRVFPGFHQLQISQIGYKSVPFEPLEQLISVVVEGCTIVVSTKFKEHNGPHLPHWDWFQRRL